MPRKLPCPPTPPLYAFFSALATPPTQPHSLYLPMPHKLPCPPTPPLYATFSALTTPPTPPHSPIPQKQPLHLCTVAAISYAAAPLRFLHSFRSPNFYHFHVSPRFLLFLRFLYSPRPPNFSVPSVPTFPLSSTDVTIPSSSFEEKSFLK